MLNVHIVATVLCPGRERRQWFPLKLCIIVFRDVNIELEKLLVKIKKDNKYAFIMGDFNVNTILETKIYTNSVQDFIKILSSCYYHTLINLPTRERNITYPLLNNIYTNMPDCYNTCTSDVLEFITQSDHYPIFTIRNKMEPTKPQTHITRRNHSNKNIALFRKQIIKELTGKHYIEFKK